MRRIVPLIAIAIALTRCTCVDPPRGEGEGEGDGEGEGVAEGEGEGEGVGEGEGEGDGEGEPPPVDLTCLDDDGLSEAERALINMPADSWLEVPASTFGFFCRQNGLPDGDGDRFR